LQTQSRYLQNAAYIRLKNLQLGYTIPSNITKKIGVEKFRVYISGENLWTLTKCSTIFDPETIDGESLYFRRKPLDTNQMFYHFRS